MTPQINPEELIERARQDPNLADWIARQEAAAEHEDELLQENISIKRWVEDLHYDRLAERNGYGG